jgi:hypothetical protein
VLCIGVSAPDNTARFQNTSEFAASAWEASVVNHFSSAAHWQRHVGCHGAIAVARPLKRKTRQSEDGMHEWVKVVMRQHRTENACANAKLSHAGS